MDVKDMYSCFSNLDELQQSEEEENHELTTPSNPATPCTPITPINPHTPSTPASHSISDDTDKSTFSVSMDSGLGSPDDFCLPHAQTTNMVPVRSLIGSGSVKASKAADHTSKEKQRRERIKESCDQLRVLLPYIRGRKTDMASTLEMCVDYLHIVNTFMPQTLQDEIVDMLSKDASLVQNRDMLLRRKNKENKMTPESQSVSKVTATITSHTAGLSSPGGFGDSQKKSSSPPSLLALSSNEPICSDLKSYLDKAPKRLRLQTDCATDSTSLDARLDPTDHTQCSASRVIWNTQPTRTDTRHQITHCGDIPFDPVAGHGEVKLPNYVYHTGANTGLHNTTGFQDLEEQNYTRLYSGSTFPDTYNSTQQYFTTFTTAKTNSLDSESLRPMYVDSTLYRYYPSVLPSTADQTRLYNPATEYVNPNTVLPGVPYSNVRLKTASEVLKEEPGPRSANG